jgi:hypothetical protein
MPPKKMDSDFGVKYDDLKPVPYKAVRVWLADGTRLLGMWTGERWWSKNGEITPARWKPAKRKKKTKKLQKALRKSAKGQT